MVKQEKSSNPKKPLYKKWWFWVIILAVIGAVGGGLSGGGDTSGPPTTSQQEPQAPTSSPEPSETPGEAPDEDTSDPEIENSESSGTTEADARDALDDALGSTTFYENVRNDVTGKWRALVFYSSENIVDHAVEYYNAYFSSDDEIHIAVNLGLKTTSVMNAADGYIYINVHEYIDGEEHDAKVLGGGELLKSYIVNLETGETEDLSAEE